MCKTQKARGLEWLRQNKHNHWSLSFYGTPPFIVVAARLLSASGSFSWDDTVAAWETYKVPFVRPCPVQPTHGFVESRIARCVTEIMAIADETWRADPGGELVIMPALAARFNAIVTPTALVLGPGHDGATGGKNALTIPLSSDLPMPEGIIADGEVPYLEVIGCDPAITDSEYRNVLQAVQYRSGPKHHGSADYIPADVEVRSVIEPNGDLLQWSETVRSFEPGTVVYHSGGSLASHYGAHCVANGVPYLTSRKPAVGETLHCTRGWGRRQLLSLAGYIRAYSKRPTHPKHLSLALAICHNIASYIAAIPSEGAMRLLAYSLVAVARYATGASVGELRHSRRVSMALFRRAGYTYGSRDCIYDEALVTTIYECVPLLQLCYEDFGRPWQRGFGGAAWQRATRYALQFVRALVAFAQSAQTKTLQRMIGPLNLLLHAQHNEGWWLNKWFYSHDANTIAFAPSRVILECYDSVMQIAHEPVEPCREKTPTATLDDVYESGRASLPTRSTFKELFDAAFARSSAAFLQMYDDCPLPPAEPVMQLPAATMVLPGRVTLNKSSLWLHFQVPMPNYTFTYFMDLTPKNMLVARHFHQMAIRKQLRPPLDNFESEGLQYAPITVGVLDNHVVYVQLDGQWYLVGEEP